MSRPPYAGDGSHTSSYYAASANPSPERPELQGDHEIDVCIVGAGYSGLSTGLHLAEKGYKVAIIEGARVGWGASGRNGGQIVNGLNASLQTIKRRYGQDTATFVAGLVQEADRRDFTDNLVSRATLRLDVSTSLISSPEGCESLATALLDPANDAALQALITENTALADRLRNLLSPP